MSKGLRHFEDHLGLLPFCWVWTYVVMIHSQDPYSDDSLRRVCVLMLFLGILNATSWASTEVTGEPGLGSFLPTRNHPEIFTFLSPRILEWIFRKQQWRTRIPLYFGPEATQIWDKTIKLGVLQKPMASTPRFCRCSGCRNLIRDSHERVQNTYLQEFIVCLPMG